MKLKKFVNITIFEKYIKYDNITVIYDKSKGFFFL